MVAISNSLRTLLSLRTSDKISIWHKAIGSTCRRPNAALSSSSTQQSQMPSQMILRRLLEVWEPRPPGNSKARSAMTSRSFFLIRYLLTFKVSLRIAFRLVTMNSLTRQPRRWTRRPMRRPGRKQISMRGLRNITRLLESTQSETGRKRCSTLRSKSSGLPLPRLLPMLGTLQTLGALWQLLTTWRKRSESSLKTNQASRTSRSSRVSSWLTLA